MLETVSDRARYLQLRLSPDNSHLVASQTELQTGNNADIWVRDLASGQEQLVHAQPHAIRRDDLQERSEGV